MKKNIVIAFLLFIPVAACLAQSGIYTNTVFLRQLYQDKSYLREKDSISTVFRKALPGHWGEFVRGVDEDLVTRQKILALTFDACGGPHGDDFDKELIAFLEREKIPATLFVSGKWIDANLETLKQLSKNPLFEIENHGLNHRPCSVDGESEYGIKGTPDVPDAFDEIEANARKIKAITGRRPVFYRSATAYTDESCAKIARCLHTTIISFDVLSGDAIPFSPVKTIVNNVLTTVKPGAIIIMHFNRPKWNTYEALKVIVPELKKQGYSFAQLKDYPLKGR